MISSGILESQGRWRSITVVAILALGILPAGPLLFGALTSLNTPPLEAGVAQLILRSLSVAAGVTFASFILGVPAGIVAGLYDFPCRRMLLALSALPLLIPSFILAIGLSALRSHWGFAQDGLVSGWSGTVLAFCSPASAFVMLATFVATRHLSKNQIESVRLEGGELLLMRRVFKAVMPVGILTAILMGILTLADPGPGQILGFSGVAYAVLVNFSASYDFALATKHCLALSGVVLLLSTPIAVLIAPRVSSALLAKDTTPARLSRSKTGAGMGLLIFCGLLSGTTILPLAGIGMPLLSEFPAMRALSEIRRTAFDTVLYAILAGLMATLLGFLFAFAVGREARLIRLASVGLFLSFSLPPTLSALGLIQTASSAPAELDILMRSRFTVGFALALRFFPVAAFLGIRAWGATAPAQVYAASLHGISLWTYLGKILLPMLAPALLVSCAVVALLATAEVGTVLLLRPPGADSLPVQIFTVMANAPESLTAALCLFYVAASSLLLMAGWRMSVRRAEI